MQLRLLATAAAFLAVAMSAAPSSAQTLGGSCSTGYSADQLSLLENTVVVCNGTTGSIGLGYKALASVTTATGNTAVGYEALRTPPPTIKRQLATMPSPATPRVAGTPPSDLLRFPLIRTVISTLPLAMTPYGRTQQADKILPSAITRCITTRPVTTTPRSARTR